MVSSSTPPKCMTTFNLSKKVKYKYYKGEDEAATLFKAISK